MESFQPRYRYIVKVHSLHDGWTRWFGHFKTEADANNAIDVLMPVAISSHELPLEIIVKRTIVFKGK